MDTLLLSISNSKLFNGCIMLLMNIGGKYLVLDLPGNMEKLFSTYFVLRCLVLFSIFFMATRDIKISIMLSLLFFILIKFFINEKSTFCLVSQPESKIAEKPISKEEYDRAQNIVSKYISNLRNN
jgi:hypothetical protein